jgi:hypothetical protein
MPRSRERWLSVVGYEGLYEVSDRGRVRGLPREVWHYRGGSQRLQGRVLRLTPHGRGYVKAVLSREGQQRTVGVHRLVLATFIGPCPPGMVAAHHNGRPSDNRLSNLRWDTQVGNMADTLRHGTHVNTRGERHGQAKLTETQVLTIYAARGRISQRTLARRYGIGQTQITRIQRGESWGWLTQPSQERAG